MFTSQENRWDRRNLHSRDILPLMLDTIAFSTRLFYPRILAILDRRLSVDAWEYLASISSSAWPLIVCNSRNVSPASWNLEILSCRKSWIRMCSRPASLRIRANANLTALPVAGMTFGVVPLFFCRIYGAVAVHSEHRLHDQSSG